MKWREKNHRHVAEVSPPTPTPTTNTFIAPSPPPSISSNRGTIICYYYWAPHHNYCNISRIMFMSRAAMTFTKRLRPRVLALRHPRDDASLSIVLRHIISTSSLLQPMRSRYKDNHAHFHFTAGSASSSSATSSSAVATTSSFSSVVRHFSSSSQWDAEYQGRLARRNKNIRMHPEGHGQHILPGNFVIKKHPKTGAERKVFLEHALGYFWAFKVRDENGEL